MTIRGAEPRWDGGGAVVVAVMFVPVVARGWVRRAISMLPVVFQGISTARKDPRS